MDDVAQGNVPRRVVPGTDSYYERMTGQPFDMEPAPTPVPMPQPRPEAGGYMPISYEQQGAAQPALRNVGGRFGGSVPVFGQQAGVQRTAADAPAGNGADPKPAKALKLTESQSKDVNFYNRGIYAHDIVSNLETALQQQPDAALGDVPIVGGAFKSSDYRQAEQAAREFLAVVLRKDTGAAVTGQEIALYTPLYIPTYWDDPATLEAKRASRERFLEGLYYGSGEARPVYDEIRTKFDAQKNSAKRKQLINKYGLEE